MSPLCPERLAANVCVSAVVPFRSRVLSHETKTLNEDRTLYQLVTAPLQKHFVGGSAFFHRTICETYCHRSRALCGGSNKVFSESANRNLNICRNQPHSLSKLWLEWRMCGLLNVCGGIKKSLFIVTRNILVLVFFFFRL